MDYINIMGEVVTPSTENKAYEQTNNRISNLEERIQSDIAETHQNINEAVSEIDSRVSREMNTFNSRVSSEISTINSRVNTIIAHNNDTEGNSELIDIRTGSDGTVYASAGSAVREQYAHLTNVAEQFIAINSLSRYYKTLNNKTIGIISGNYQITDSETDKIVLVSIADLFNNGDVAMIGTTNTSVSTVLLLDENMNKLGNLPKKYLLKSTFKSLEYAEQCVYAAWTYPMNTTLDFSVVSYSHYNNHLNDSLIETGKNLIKNWGYSHGCFTASGLDWNEGYRSTNIFEIPAGESVSFNAPITQERYLVLMDENLAFLSRTPVTVNQQGQSIYVNEGNTKLYAYISSKVETYPVQTPNIAVIGTYSTNELNSMGTNELNDHFLPQQIPYDLTFALVSQNMAKTGYYGKIFSALGDSLTATGSGGIYLNLIKNALKLEKYKNCGNGGTRVSGNYETAFWQDSRVEQLDINSTVITIMGGTNDAPFITVNDSDFTFDNCDTNNFVGAYNVLLSKIFYKFLKRTSGYYQAIDYNNLTQVDTVDPDFRVVLITPPQRLDSDTNNLAAKATGEYVKRIGQMWGIPVVEAYSEMQMNDMTYTENREDKIHFTDYFHKKLAEMIIGKLRLLNPID